MHYSRRVQTHCRDNGIVLIFNGIYSSEFNCVERLWRLSKLRFRRELITTTNYHDKRHVQALVRRCICDVNAAPLKAHAQSCLNVPSRMLSSLKLSNSRLRWQSSCPHSLSCPLAKPMPVHFVEWNQALVSDPVALFEQSINSWPR